MKLQILSGALGLVLLLGLVPLQPAEARVFVIDDLENDSFDTCDFDTQLGTPMGAVQTGVVGVIDMIRECKFVLTTTNPGSNGILTFVQASGMLRMETGDMVETTTELIYDGEALPANGRSLGLNLLSSDDLRIVYSAADFAVDVNATLIDSDGTIVSIIKQFEQLTNTDKELLFPLASFFAADNNLNLGDIDAIHVRMETTTGGSGLSDFTLELIDITMEMVGGEMFPVDTTALLLAGAELNAIWILPAIAAIGIGAFIVSRKRN